MNQAYFDCCVHCACDPKENHPVHTVMCGHGCNDDTRGVRAWVCNDTTSQVWESE